MGSWSQFVCDDCGYSAEVSGGRDYGGITHIQTSECEHCRELVDVVVATDRPEDEERQRKVGRCPRCGATSCLFFEQRRWRHFGEPFDDETLAYVRTLIAKIRDHLAHPSFS